MDAERVGALLAAAGIARDQVRAVASLTGGTFNEVYRVTLATEIGAEIGLVLKVAPSPAQPALRHEHGLLHAEALFYQLAADCCDAPLPTPVYCADDGGFLLMTECPGRPWSEAADQIAAADRPRLRAELGGLVAGLHAMTGSGFGYPTGALGPLHDRWRAAFLAMVDAVLDDAERYRATLPAPPAAIRELFTARAALLDAVTTPVLVHFDLWDGNILVDLDGGMPRVGGIIDAERAFWGDPLADFVSLALLSDIEQDHPFLCGYRDADGPVSLDGDNRTRLAMYRAYLSLIMLVEMEPRAFPAASRRRREQRVVPALLADLNRLAPSLANSLSWLSAHYRYARYCERLFRLRANGAGGGLDALWIVAAYHLADHRRDRRRAARLLRRIYRQLHPSRHHRGDDPGRPA